jgi:hypothetical protein
MATTTVGSTLNYQAIFADAAGNPTSVPAGQVSAVASSDTSIVSVASSAPDGLSGTVVASALGTATVSVTVPDRGDGQVITVSGVLDVVPGVAVTGSIVFS